MMRRILVKRHLRNGHLVRAHFRNGGWTPIQRMWGAKHRGEEWTPLEEVMKVKPKEQPPIKKREKIPWEKEYELEQQKIAIQKARLVLQEKERLRKLGGEESGAEEALGELSKQNERLMEQIKAIELIKSEKPKAARSTPLITVING